MPDRQYLDFEFAIEQLGDERYRTRVLDSPAGQASGTFTFPLSALEIENFLLRLGRGGGTRRRLESSEREAARTFGGKLFDAVFTDEVETCLRRSIDEAERSGQGLRIRLRLSDAPALHGIPWEYLYSSSNDRFLVLSSWTPLIRYLELPRRVTPLRVEPPLRILVMISSPSDYPSLDTEAEWNRLNDGLADLVVAGRVELHRLDDASLVSLQRALLAHDYHVLHFIGHGGFDEASGDGVLMLEEESGRARIIPGRDLGIILHDHRSLRLTVLNACEGARTSAIDPLAGSAQSLLRAGIPAVVAMQFEISDDAAIAFGHAFYGAIALGLPVDAAVTEARKAVFGQSGGVEWGTPVVYMRSPDGRIFDMPDAVEVELGPPPSTDAQGGATGIAVVQPVSDDLVDPPPAPDVESVPEPEPIPEAEPAHEPEPLPEPEQEPGPAVDRGALPAQARGTSEPTFSGPWRRRASAGDPSRGGGVRIAAAGVIVAAIVGVGVFALMNRGDDAPPANPGGTATDDGNGTSPAVLEEPDSSPLQGPVVTARRMENFDADGQLDEWFGLDTHVTTPFPVFVSSQANWDGSDDVASKWWVGWDDDNLYLAVSVTDNIHNQPSQGNQIFRGDAVDIHIGLDVDGSNRPSDDDFQIILSPGDFAGSPPTHVIFQGDGTQFAQDFTSDEIDVAARQTTTGYRIEAKIPWSEFRLSEAPPQLGDVPLLLLLSVFDNDGEVEASSGRVAQTVVKSHVDGGFQSPREWGRLVVSE